MHQNNKKKTARLEARITLDVHALVQRAAILQGRSVSDFVVAAAQRAAEETIARRHTIELSLADQQRFVAALLKPAALAPAMKRAAAAHGKLIQPS